MKIRSHREPILLFLGDALAAALSLWLTLLVRFQELPSPARFYEHLVPFSLLFLVWFVVFFIAGLYEKQTTTFKKSLPVRLLNTQIFNSLLAVTFFYLVPYFGITPKTILFIYLVLSIGFISIWRSYGHRLFTLRQREKALIIGEGSEVDLLKNEINTNPRYNFQFVSETDFKEVTVIVVDLQSKDLEKNLPDFYNLLFSGVRFIDINELYEEVFNRIPISLVTHRWFLENVFQASSFSYDLLKRSIDVLISTLLGILSLVFYPFVMLSIKLDDQGAIFIDQERVGKNNKLVQIKKFRTMSFNDNESADNKQLNKITRVGRFLRLSRLDELPQLWNVLRGDLSLTGPRPELPALTKVYEEKVPYYRVRHLIKPGLSGWAQIYHENHPHQGANAEETKNKLSYDLYYIKNRSVALDLKIILKTIKTVLSRSGR